jgi:hypothetical protein
MSDHNEVLRWRFGDVAALLLAGCTQLTPPPDWRCWTEPTPLLPIDETIIALKRRNAQPRLREPAELKKQNVDCPFYFMRFAIAAAVDAATISAGNDPAEMAARYRTRAEAAEKAAAEIETLSTTVLESARSPAPRLPFLETPEVIWANKEVLAFRRRGALARIAEDAQHWLQYYQRARGEPFDVWRMVLVAELGFVWNAMTGAIPTQGEEFTAFIVAAFESAAGIQPKVSWERAIRRVIKLDLDWERRGMSFAEAQKIYSGRCT